MWTALSKKDYKDFTFLKSFTFQGNNIISVKILQEISDDF